MADLDYAAEKMHTALFSLIGDGPIKPRLASAFLSFHVLTPDYFGSHPDLHSEFAKLMGLLTAREATYEGQGRVPATIAAMSDADAVDVAEAILSFSFSVDRARIDAAADE